MNTAIICDPISVKHLTGKGHPERPERYLSITNALQQAGLQTPSNTLSPKRATPEDIIRCHTRGYYEIVEKNIRACKESGYVNGEWTLSTGDVQISPDTWEAAHYAAGAVLTAVDAVMENKFKNAFCVVRPPGHHATPTFGMGFCVFNNVAIGARYLQNKYGVERVLIVDWDVHHGNGTQDIFYADPSVFYFSTHQAQIYPGTGHVDERGIGEGLGTNLNVPIEANLFSRAKVLQAFSVQLAAAMKSFKPQFILISSGFDAHMEDPLGGFNLETEDFATLTTDMMKLAKEYANGRIVSVLEGGYNLQAIANSSVAHVGALSGTLV